MLIFCNSLGTLWCQKKHEIIYMISLFKSRKNWNPRFVTTFLGIALIFPCIWGKQRFPEFCITSSLKCPLRRFDLLVETKWNNAKKHKDLVHLYQKTRPTVISAYSNCVHIFSSYIKIRSSKQLFGASALLSHFWFPAVSWQHLRHRLPGTPSMNTPGEQPGEMPECRDKLSRWGRAGRLPRTQPWRVAANGQQCLLLGAFLWRFLCFDFYDDPQARWVGDARILNPAEALSSFMLSIVGSSAHTERVGPQLSIRTEGPGALTDLPPTYQLLVHVKYS